MTEWEPATDAEVAMREALRTDDQESYFRILAGVDLLLPVSADALAGLAPLGWGTWSTGGRTHVLAFTSPSALQACLADYSGSARRVAYQELAHTWPNLEWWLAVNPGLPIEGYLPAWFVAQLARGDLRLPTRAGRDTAAQATQKIQSSAAGGPTPAPPAGPVRPAAVPVGSPYGAAAADRGASAGSDVTPGGLPVRAPGTVLASGLPARVPGVQPPVPGQPGEAQSPGSQSPGPQPISSQPISSQPSGPQRGGAHPDGLQTGDPHRSTPTSVAPTSAVPAAYRSPVVPPRPASPAGPASPQGPVSPPAPNPIRQPAAPAQAASSQAASSQAASSQAASSQAASSQAASSQAAPFEAAPSQAASSQAVPRQPAQTEPSLAGQPATTPSSADRDLPGHDRPDDVRSSHDQQSSDERRLRPDPTGRPLRSESEAGPVPTGPTFGGALPRRPVTPPSERPTSMAAAAQAMAAARAAQSAQPTRPGIVPPVVPGAPGGGRPAAGPAGPGFPPSNRTGEPASTPPGATGNPAAVPLTDAAAPADPITAPATSTARTFSADVTIAPDDSTHPRIAPSATADAAAGRGRSEPDEDEFQPANGVEQDLYNAADGGSTDVFLSTLLLATVLVPVGPQSRPGTTPGEPGFVFRTDDVDDETYLTVFTSPDRLAEHHAEPVRTVGVRFFELIRSWPDPDWSFSVNPGSPIGAKLPGAQVIALANWATDAGLGDDPVPARREDEPVPVPQADADPSQQPTMMQKTLPPEQVDYFLERGYDRVAGFVHRAAEVAHLRTPAELHAALGLGYAGSPYRPDAKEAYVLRWPAYRPSLYRIPYGGQNEHALRAMDGWVIERAPFRGNGFAPGESRDVIAEFKVDSTRLPHGAQLWRMDADGAERIIAVFDADAPVWRRVGAQ